MQGYTLIQFQGTPVQEAGCTFRQNPMSSRIAHTPLGHTIDAMDNGHYWVCDRDHNCREISGLWEAEEYIREMEIGIRDQ